MLKRKIASFLLIAATSSSHHVVMAQPTGITAAQSHSPIAVEKNPPGDIPDNQAFVEYRSPLGFSIKIPEGWARQEKPTDVRFSDKYNRVQVEVSAQPVAPSVVSIKASEASAAENSPNAIRMTGVTKVSLPAGAVIVAHYGANSDVNPVTNKAIRQDNARYYFWKAGKLAVLTLSAPAGADNVDQWQLMAKSFAWR